MLALLGAQRAEAQIVHKRPGQVKADNRRALREAARTDSPYKDSHLDVKPASLKRGQSAPPRPERGEEVQYQTGAASNAKPAGFSGGRRKKKS